jgi:hypothetical protein
MAHTVRSCLIDARRFRTTYDGIELGRLTAVLLSGRHSLTKPTYASIRSAKNPVDRDLWGLEDDTIGDRVNETTDREMMIAVVRY